MGAYGNANFPLLPYADLGAGLRTPFGTIIPPGGNVIYLRSTGPQDFDPPEIAARCNLTLESALAQCRAGRHDRIVALKGHSQNVTDATMMNALVNGTTIVGDGNPEDDDAPTFRWTATGSQWAITKKNITFANLKLRLEGANGVAKAINVTAGQVRFITCDIEIASGAANLATIAVEVGAGANRFTMAGNIVRGTTDIVTDVVKIVSAVDMVRILDNEFNAAATAAVGFVNIGAAATNIRILRNYMANGAAASTACISAGAFASTGGIGDNFCGTINNGVATAQGIILNAASLIRCFQNFSCDEAGKSGVLTPTVVAT